MGRLPEPSGASAWERTPVLRRLGNHSLLEHWFKELGPSRTPQGIVDRRYYCRCVALRASEQFLLIRKRLIDRSVHRLNSTPGHVAVNRIPAHALVLPAVA